jgi:hypothetical protein
MKPIFLFLGCLVTCFSCKKEDVEKRSYIQGVLMDSIDGNRLPNTKLYFYKNEVPGILGFFEEEEELLEITTTDAYGNFNFEGIGTSDESSCTSGTSIRLGNGDFLANGCLGKSTSSKNALDSNGYLGTLYTNGADFSLMALVAKTSSSGVDHEVTDFNFSYSSSVVMNFYNDSLPNWTVIEISSKTSRYKSFYKIGPEDDPNLAEGGYRLSNNRMYIKEIATGLSKTIDIGALLLKDGGFQGDFYYTY